MKFMTEGEAETMRQQAIEFLRRIGNNDDADRFEAMDAAEYAEHKRVELLENPNSNRTDRRKNMARGKSKADLESELDEAKDYIEQLEGKLDDIAGIAASHHAANLPSRASSDVP
jgi:predicted RNase H-like nuclease (RuvC/YqgF family)